MANLLYRIGRASARRAGIVIGAWIGALVVAGGGFLLLGGQFSNSFSIPGTETERVTQDLAASLPELTGATATVVFATADGTPFTAEQKAAILWRLILIEDIEGVVSAVDPFATAQMQAEAGEQLTVGGEQIVAAVDQLDTQQAELSTAQERLDLGIAAAKAIGAYGLMEEQFAQQQAQIDAGMEQISQARTELLAQTELLSQGRVLWDAASGIRTVSEDGSAAVAFVSFTEDQYAMSSELKLAVADVLDNQPIAGVDVAYNATIGTTVEGLLGWSEVIGVILAGLVLMVMLRSFLPAVTPIVNSLVGMGTAVLASMALSGSVDMASVTPMLGVMLGLAVGIDYALFILYRHRRQVLAGAEITESIALANGTAGNAVVFAGATVIVALAALGVTGIPFLTVMGLVAAFCVLVAVAVSITFTPAVLALLGSRVVHRSARRTIGDGSHSPKTVTPMSTGRAVVTGLVGTVALLVMAIPALSMRLGLPDGSSEAPESPQYRAQEILGERFGAGMNGPLLVVATSPSTIMMPQQQAFQAEVVQRLMGHEDVVAVAPAGTSLNGKVFAFQVIPAEGPTSESTEVLVQELRASTPLTAGTVIPDGTTVGVAGQATGNIDISAKLFDALPLYLAVVVGLSTIVLVVVFRSVMMPIIATGGFVLSLLASLGAMTAVYQWGWLGGIFDVHHPGPLLSFAPILIMGVLFGLAMDYQLFLGSGMREAYVHGLPARYAVAAGVRLGRAVVIAAAIIMIAVFGGFVFSHLGMVRPLGFGLAVGVLFDAFVVRLLLVPSAMHLLGDKAWWIPRWLDRLLPKVDVEGAELERTHPLHVTGVDEERTLATAT